MDVMFGCTTAISTNPDPAAGNRGHKSRVRGPGSDHSIGNYGTETDREGQEGRPWLGQGLQQGDEETDVSMATVIKNDFDHFFCC
jgi:hypothetical protein